MSAPKRAILANIHERKLDPTTSYSQLDKTGKFFMSSQEVIKSSDDSFISKQKVVHEVNQEQPQYAIEQKVIIDDVQEVPVEKPVIELSLEKEAVKALIVEELKTPETLLDEVEHSKISSTSTVNVDLQKKKFKKKN